MAVATFLDLCLDVNDGEQLERFWAAVLGYQLVHEDSGPSYLTAPDSGIKVWVNVVPEPKTGKNRVHLDVHCADVADLLALGAVVVRPPDATDHWWSLESPEGDEFCAFVRSEVPANRLYEIVIDCADAAAQASWWHAMLGGHAQEERGSYFLDDVPSLPCDYVVFQPVPEAKIAKNRVHVDVRADVQAVVSHGGTVLREPVPGDTSWHVVADPEGNEFCVFPPV